ncbi:RNA polymerase sigma factor [Sphingobium mellinum]|uniref:RNA polymerase sigma factor n=1 Tax=Sphingobium mellinum TaxID=1387166 RepID=UPI0030EDE8F3
MDCERDRDVETLYGLHRAELRRLLVARVGDPVEAEDLLQELWLRVRERVDGPVENGRAYLFRMAQNLVIDRRRERHRRMARERRWSDEETGFARPGEDPADHRQSAEALMIAREEVALLASAIGNLPEGARRAFKLHKLDGLTHAEVAQQLGISKSGVEKHMAVAMKYLRRSVSSWGDE